MAFWGFWCILKFQSLQATTFSGFLYGGGSSSLPFPHQPPPTKQSEAPEHRDSLRRSTRGSGSLAELRWGAVASRSLMDPLEEMGMRQGPSHPLSFKPLPLPVSPVPVVNPGGDALPLGARLGAALSAVWGRAMLVELYTCNSSTRLPWF